MKDCDTLYKNIEKTQGFCLWMTGLSGAGKTTLAQAIAEELNDHNITTSLLDGDVVREHLSKGLGFSRADRDTNVLRIGFVASEIARHDGISICSTISPYRDTRQSVRQMFTLGRFIELHVSTPLEVCEGRDVKGLYHKARSGLITGFTGIDDAYEAPLAPEITLDTAELSLDNSVVFTIDSLAQRGLVAARR